MMSEYSYEMPDNKKVFNALIKMLNLSGHSNIAELLRNGSLSLRSSSDYSTKYGGRYDTLVSSVTFYVKAENYEKFKSEDKTILLKLINDIVPAEAGFDFFILNVSITLDESDEDLLSSVIGDLSDVTDQNGTDYLSQDLVKKGRDMSEAYALLYVIENSLRQFLISAFESEYGSDTSKIKISRDVKNHIESRKQEEKSKKWVSPRGDSDIYYTDFSDLASIVENNFSVFEEYFSDIAWFKVKMNEMYECRKKIGHCGLLDADEIDVLKVNYKMIMKYICKK